MSNQSITIKIVTAPAFRDCSAILTPRLGLRVAYTKGGTSFMNYKSFPRGYEISVLHDRKSDQGFISMIIDGKGNPTASIEPASRFSEKTLRRIADEVYGGNHDWLIRELYAKAVSNRPEYAWPESILPLVEPTVIPSDGFADGGYEYTDEELLHKAVVAVVDG